jgi:hypothetical protein
MDAHSPETISARIKAGQIRLGMTRTELRTLLGEPDAMGCSSRKNKVPSVWKYGEVEFSFLPARSLRVAERHGLHLVYVEETDHELSSCSSGRMHQSPVRDEGLGLFRHSLGVMSKCARNALLKYDRSLNPQR